MTDVNKLSSESTLLQISEKHIKYGEYYFKDEVGLWSFKKLCRLIVVLFHYFFLKFISLNQTVARIYSGHFNIH